MEKQLKHLRFPKELVDRINRFDGLPKWADFTTKVFMLLELALLNEGKKKAMSSPNLLRRKVSWKFSIQTGAIFFWTTKTIKQEITIMIVHYHHLIGALSSWKFLIACLLFLIGGSVVCFLIGLWFIAIDRHKKHIKEECSDPDCSCNNKEYF